MDLLDLRQSLQLTNVGEAMHALIRELYPLCRSITGNGTRETLEIIKRHISLQIHEVPSGTQVFDWVIPREWNIRDAYVKDSRGVRIIDFQKSNLHVLGYSVPIKCRMSLQELRSHLFTLPDQPDLVPYRNSFYSENWGFCLSHRQYLAMKDDEYEVCIDSTLEDGSLSFGEYYVPGQSPDEILLACHICHPSLCNDNLSGISLVTLLAHYVSLLPKPRYSYRFLFVPVTIGSIAWLALNEFRTSRIRNGLVVALVGDAGKSTYKRSRRGNAEIDGAFAHVLRESGHDYEIVDFSPFGYDERQFCSPGFNLPVGCLMRTPHGQFPEYHTSGDNLEFVQPRWLEDSLEKCLAALNILEHDRTYVSRNPKGEPQLGKRGLYRAAGDRTGRAIDEVALLWVLNLADGHHSLLSIAERSGLEFSTVKGAADTLVEHGLLEEQTR